MNFFAKTALAACAAALLCTQALAQTPSYHLTRLQPMPDAPDLSAMHTDYWPSYRSVPVINNVGGMAWTRNVVIDLLPGYSHYEGYVGGPGKSVRAVTYQDGTYVGDIAPIAGGNLAYAINDHGAVVGSSMTPMTTYSSLTPRGYRMALPLQAFVSEQGQTIDLGYMLDGKVRSLGASAAINNLGQVVGTMTSYGVEVDGSYFNLTTTDTAFIYRNGELSVLGGLRPNMQSNATDISDSGHVVGATWFSAGDGNETSGIPGDGLKRAFIYHNGEIRYLSPPDSDSFDTQANAVNNFGVAVGSQSDSAVIFQDDQLIVIGRGVASDINDKGVVVGTSYKAENSVGGYGFVYQDGQMHDLSNLLASPYAGWRIELARQINQGGEIVALAHNPVTRMSEYVILSPVPETSILWMSACGVLVCALAGRRRRSAFHHIGKVASGQAHEN